VTGDMKYITLTDDNFQNEVIESPKPVLVDFWVGWRAQCHMIAPAISELATDFEGLAKVGRLDVDNNPNTIARHCGRFAPLLLFFNNGYVVDHIFGVVPKTTIAEKLNALVRTK